VSHGGRGSTTRGGRGGRGLLNKCSGCGSLDYIMSSGTASDDALLKWTRAKRKFIVQQYGTPNGTPPAHDALLGDMSHDDLH
jgi:hypothetical protein